MNEQKYHDITFGSYHPPPLLFTQDALTSLLKLLCFRCPLHECLIAHFTFLMQKNNHHHGLLVIFAPSFKVDRVTKEYISLSQRAACTGARINSFIQRCVGLLQTNRERSLCYHVARKRRLRSATCIGLLRGPKLTRQRLTSL